MPQPPQRNSTQQPKIQLLEELSLNALPALQTVCVEGWLVRFAAGYTRRANSVTPLYAGYAEQKSGVGQAALLAKVRYCEDIYRARNLPAIFKLTTATQPAQLDQLLAAKGYQWHNADGVSVQTLNLQNFEASQVIPRGVTVSQSPLVSDGWFNAYCQLNDLAECHQPILRAMLASIRTSCNFVALILADETASGLESGTIGAVGLAVAERGYVGLFDIVTAPAVRQRGLGRLLVNQLLLWGQQQAQATEAYLQVLTSNAPALQLYRGLGFADTYSYWYRLKPTH